MQLAYLNHPIVLICLRQITQCMSADCCSKQTDTPAGDAVRLGIMLGRISARVVKGPAGEALIAAEGRCGLVIQLLHLSLTQTQPNP